MGAVAFSSNARVSGSGPQAWDVGPEECGRGKTRVAVKELTVSYHNPKTISCTIYPYHGNLNQVRERHPEKLSASRG